MHNFLGFSLYLSSFAAQCPALRGPTGTGVPVFFSLHISEEFDETYCTRAEEACRMLTELGYRIVADVSAKTLKQFCCENLVELARRLGLWALRIDYGFSEREIREIAVETAAWIAACGREVYAMHNFYPRPETGLDEELLLETTRKLQQAGLKVLAFIPGDGLRRGPLHEGLPTLEAHRNVRPSAAFVDMAVRFGIDGIFLGDPGISTREAERIDRYCRENVISVPAELESEYGYLYDQVFTCRVDSPRWLVRFQESRMYSCPGRRVEPACCGPRDPGCITIDNEKYGRYSGELMLIRQPLKADERVNVIGRVCEDAMLLLPCIRGGQKFVLVRP